MATKTPGNGRKKKAEQEPEWTGMESPAPYADIARSMAGERHFLVSFAQSKPLSREFVVVAQVYLHPETTGELLTILAGQVSKYEKKYGKKITPENFTFSLQPDGEENDDE